MCYGMGCEYEIQSGPAVGECALPIGMQNRCPEPEPEIEGVCMDCMWARDLLLSAHPESESTDCFYVCGRHDCDHFEHVLTDTHPCDDGFERRVS